MIKFIKYRINIKLIKLKSMNHFCETYNHVLDLQSFPRKSFSKICDQKKGRNSLNFRIKKSGSETLKLLNRSKASIHSNSLIHHYNTNPIGLRMIIGNENKIHRRIKFKINNNNNKRRKNISNSLYDLFQGDLKEKFGKQNI